MEPSARPFETVTVFGGATLDRVSRSSAPPVMGASNPGTMRRIVGGVGFNVATVLARLGMPTRMVTAIGDDSDGEAIVTAAGGVGIDTGGIAVIHGASTAGYHATFDDRGNLIIGIADMKVCEAITPAAVAAAMSGSGDRDLWVVDANLPEVTLAFLTAEATSAGRRVAALTVSPVKALRLVPLLDDLSYLFTNRKEAAALLDRDPNDPSLVVTELAGGLAGHRAATVVVTNGTDPLALACQRDVRSFAPLRAAVKGVNGAGDSFAAGMIAALSEGLTPAEAVRFGLAAAVMTLEAGSIVAAPFSKDALAERIGAGPQPAGAVARERIAS